MEEHASYLKHIKFDPKLFGKLNAKYLANPRLLILILITVVSLGIFSFINLPRRLNPEIKIPIVLVGTILPGANPSDVESLVTIPIEDSLTNLTNLKTMSSSSRESASTISLEFESGVDPDKALSDVQTAINGVVLPTDAIDPKAFKLDFENQPVLQFALTSKKDNASAITVSKELEDALKSLDSVKDVTVFGLEEQEIQILIKPNTISTYGINPQQLSQAISNATKAFPAGSVSTQGSTFALTIDPSIVSVDDLRKIKLNLNGSLVNLSDIAVVSFRSKPGQIQALLATPKDPGKAAITFNVFRSQNSNINKTVTQAKQKTDEIMKKYPNQFVLAEVLNTSKQVDDQFNELTRDFIITVSLVFLVLLIFLGSRQAIVSSLSVPLSFFITFTVMLLSGIAFSFLAFFSLLLALGLLVDDTIVVISAMTSYYRSGKFTPLQTGLLVWKDFVVAIFTTTITTVWAFVPLLLSTGIIGEFIKPIPIIVSTTLLASFFVAMFITLPIMILILKPSFPKRVVVLFKTFLALVGIGIFISIIPKNNTVLLSLLAFLIFIFVFIQVRASVATSLKNSFVSLRKKLSGKLTNRSFSFEHLSIRYQGFIKNIIKSPRLRRLTIVMVIIFFLFACLLLPLGLVKYEFFPKTDEDFVYVSLELPSGTNLEQSTAETKQIAEKLRDTYGLRFVTANIGQSFSADQGPSGAESNNVLFTLTLEEAKKRSKTSSEIADELRSKFKDYQTGKLSIVEQSGGPPAGADVQIKLVGDDLNILGTYAAKIEDYLKTQQGVTNIDRSIKSGTGKLVFVPDNQKLAEQGIDISQVGFWLRFFASGFKADDIRLSDEGDKPKDITLRLSDQTQQALDISSVYIPTKNSNLPITSLGSIELKPNPTLITREDGKRTLSVSASVTKGFNVSEINGKLVDFAIKQLNLPSGYSWKTGGANEENQNSVNSILEAMILSFLLIILTMVIQFSSFRKAIIVMFVIPLSIAGVFIIFALSKTPLSFPALIGILALFGIVVKNSILVVDKISQNEKAGLEFTEAIAEGSASRLEAIALTSVATIFGLIPITLSDPLWRGLGGSIISGLFFSGTIMLFIIPVVYYIWFKPAKKR